jgi:DNA-binding helix-hairpin-helix protein with protein kinase domain
MAQDWFCWPLCQRAQRAGEIAAFAARNRGSATTGPRAAHANPRTEATAAFLETFEIDKAHFVEVTRAHVEKLASRGIRTAGDIRRYRGKLTRLVPAPVMLELRTWAGQCADNFRFTTRDATYVADAAKIEEKYSRQRRAILEELRRGPELLAAKRDEVVNARARAEDVLRRKHEDMQRHREKVKE